MRGLKARMLVAGLAAVAAGGVAAYAAIPDSGKVIHGCYQAQSGQLRVVDTDRGESCRPSERSLQWNQQGPKGDPGARGPAGATGPTGPAGANSGTALSGTADAPYNTKGQTVLAIPGFGTVTISECTFSPNILDPRVNVVYQRTGTNRQRIGEVGGFASETTGGEIAAGDGGRAGALQVEDVASRRIVTITASITSDSQGCHAFAQAVGP